MLNNKMHYFVSAQLHPVILKHSLSSTCYFMAGADPKQGVEMKPGVAEKALKEQLSQAGAYTCSVNIGWIYHSMGNFMSKSTQGSQPCHRQHFCSSSHSKIPPLWVTVALVCV